jgi:3-oxoacyl-[acyl-carrier protein] reductase
VTRGARERSSRTAFDQRPIPLPSTLVAGRLASKVTVVTGSAGGLGQAIAEGYAREGAAVVVNSRSQERAAAAAEAITAAGGRAIAVEADLVRPEHATALADAAVAEFGRIDVWVNNAGVTAVGPSVEMAPEDWNRVIATNLSGCFFGSQAAARVMLAQGSGVIIQIGSIFSETALATRAPYTAAKHGLVGLTKALAVEWAPHGVRVVCLEPGYVAAGLGTKGQEAGIFTAADIGGRTPMGRFAEPKEIVAAAVFLASDEASFITGASLLVDGGWVAHGGWRL